MAENLGDIAKNLVGTTFVNRCECCGVRYKQGESDYCGYCLRRFDRKERMNRVPARMEYIVIHLVEPRYANATMDDIDLYVKEQLRARETWQDVFIFGQPGRGKTYLMAALIRAYVREGYECLRVSFDEFCCKVRSTMTPSAKQTEWELTGKLKAVDMLFIDDLGLSSKEASDFVYQTFFLILNKRQERLLPTFISSNKNLSRLAETLFDARIISRLSTALVIEMKGEDRRLSIQERKNDT